MSKSQLEFGGAKTGVVRDTMRTGGEEGMEDIKREYRSKERKLRDWL